MATPSIPATPGPTRVVRGDVLKFPDTGPPDDPKRPHAFVVLDVADGDVVAVPICTRDEDSDPACVIMPGEAPPGVVRHPSCVEYRLATKRTLASVVAMVEAAPQRALGRLTPTLYDRVVAGLGASRRARAWTRRPFFPEPIRRILPGKDG